MPIYEYSCLVCGRCVEVTHSLNDSTLRRCDACQGLLKKVPSVPTVVFRGAGWARNDRSPKA
jgi:putative FmdB family regulatory protein